MALANTDFSTQAGIDAAMAAADTQVVERPTAVLQKAPATGAFASSPAADDAQTQPIDTSAIETAVNKSDGQGVIRHDKCHLAWRRQAEQGR